MVACGTKRCLVSIVSGRGTVGMCQKTQNYVKYAACTRTLLSCYVLIFKLGSLTSGEKLCTLTFFFYCIPSLLYSFYCRSSANGRWPPKFMGTAPLFHDRNFMSHHRRSTRCFRFRVFPRMAKIPSQACPMHFFLLAGNTWLSLNTIELQDTA